MAAVRYWRRALRARGSGGITDILGLIAIPGFAVRILMMSVAMLRSTGEVRA
jgi:hypothetical protein